MVVLCVYDTRSPEGSTLPAGMQGIYVPKEDVPGTIRLTVNTFCVHGGPAGRLSGIQGSVTCANPVLLELLPEFESELERAEGIVEKCILKFDSLPFIPAEPYDVIRRAGPLGWPELGRGSACEGPGGRGLGFLKFYSCRAVNAGKEFGINRGAWESCGLSVQQYQEMQAFCLGLVQPCVCRCCP
jgi:hypothetical protein